MAWSIRVYTEDGRSPEVGKADSFQQGRDTIKDIMKNGASYQSGNTYEYWPPNRIVRISVTESRKK